MILAATKLLFHTLQTKRDKNCFFFFQTLAWNISSTLVVELVLLTRKMFAWPTCWHYICIYTVHKQVRRFSSARIQTWYFQNKNYVCCCLFSNIVIRFVRRCPVSRLTSVWFRLNSHIARELWRLLASLQNFVICYCWTRSRLTYHTAAILRNVNIWNLMSDICRCSLTLCE